MSNPEQSWVVDAAEDVVRQTETIYIMKLRALYLQATEQGKKCGCKNCRFVAKRTQDYTLLHIDEELWRLNSKNAVDDPLKE